ncbi:helix-turn-helix transcriptional regulator [Cysteiniphilum litorale]|uniref:helix-turn-helix transcriptional regulator n=1 Tax=Cysteiniphilum litorale TaxID=2056700 RepID=UPI003F8808C4
MATYDFIEAHRYPFFDRVCQDKVYLYIDNHFDKYKDIFVFGVPSKVYWRTSNYERIRIYDRARVIMEHMYRNIRFGNILDFSEAEAETKLTLESLKHRSSNYQHILEEFDLSQSSFEYLKYVSMGCITKQVASMLDTSVRTVEGRINSLCRKLDVLNKYELESAAKIITDKLIYTKTLCNGFLAA